MENILIVDDVASNLQTLANILKDEYKIKVATDGHRALELAHKEPLPDLILLDVHMPNMDGYEVLEKLLQDEQTKDIPVIFVTSNDTTNDEESGLLAGAVDYITKPVRPAIVKARVKAHITIKIQRDELLYMALNDKLTGLHNRNYLNKVGEQKFARASRHNEKMSVIMCDIDHFKNVNDTYGHLAGDKILKAIGAVLNKHKRKEDFIARYGGEEFVIILEYCTLEYALKKAELLRHEIENMIIDDIKVTSSFGVAELNTTHVNFEALLKEADDGLYISKDEGRNRVSTCRDSKDA